MLRKVYLAGDMGEKFGKIAEVSASTVREVMQYLDANHDGVREYLLEKNDKKIGFKIQIADQYIDDERELLLPLDKGDIIITPVPVGSKGAFKTILGIILVIASFFVPPGLQDFVRAMGFALIGQGIAELMAPDPSTDNSDDNKEGYLFQGAEQSVPEGNPVPILYGELRIPGQAVAFDLRNTTEAIISAENGGGSYAVSGDGQGNLFRAPALSSS
tara:strand:- start:3224 stop:3871 length:648 start_codon:yes stop_codon:yes gene_type:complete